MENVIAPMPVEMARATPSAVDRCTRVLRDGIVSGELRPGLRLPPERALAVEVRLGADVGRMTNYSIEGFSDLKDASGSIDNPSLYLSAGLSVGADSSQ